MKTAVITFFLATALPVSALSWEDINPWNKGFYAGLKSGRTNIHAQGFDDSSPIGVILGYDFGGFALEFERTQTRGEVSFFDPGIDIDYKLDTTALYAVYRTPGIFYLKLRGGYLYEDVNIKGSGRNSSMEASVSANESDNGYSAGIGAGLRDENYLVELEYTRIEEDANYVTFSFSLGF